MKLAEARHLISYCKPGYRVAFNTQVSGEWVKGVCPDLTEAALTEDEAWALANDLVFVQALYSLSVVYYGPLPGLTRWSDYRPEVSA